MATQKFPLDLGDLAPNQLVPLLSDANLREEVIYQLIKKRERCKDLAPLVWNTFNAVYLLLLEVLSVYRNLSPPTLSMREATRACNALVLFQVMANNPETRRDLIKAQIPCYLFPFLKPSGNDKPFEHMRLSSLGVLGSLAKFDDPYGPAVFQFFMETEVIRYCLECMDNCDEMSQKVATLVLMKILMKVEVSANCCVTSECFNSIVQVLNKVVQKLSQKPCLMHLKYVIQCYLSLSQILRLVGPSDAFKNQVPPQLFDNTFKDILHVKTVRALQNQLQQLEKAKGKK